MQSGADLPVATLGPYDGAEIGEYWECFRGSPLSAQRFARTVIDRGGLARIGRCGDLWVVFYCGIGPLDK